VKNFLRERMENLKKEKKENLLERILVKISKKIVKASCSCCSEKKNCKGKCNAE